MNSSHGAGWFENYVRNRSRLYEQIERRRELRRRMARKTQAELGPLEQIQDDLDELKLVVATVLDLLVAKEVLPEDELRARAEEIDVLDGRADGMLHGSIEPGGAIMPDQPPQRTALDDLAEAAEDAEREEEP